MSRGQWVMALHRLWQRCGPWGKLAIGASAAVKAVLLVAMAIGATGRAHAQPALPDLAPVRKPVPTEELDRVARASGLTDCFWAATISPGTFNLLLPDSHAVYWLAQFRLPAGARLSLEGAFAHARHVSFNTYDAQGAPVDRVNDQMLAAEPGATNPYLTGARRDAAARAYRVRLVERELVAGKAADESTRPASTLFIPQGAERQQLWYRIYLPDQGRDVRGGVALPTPVLRLADGKELRGQALCQAINVREGLVTDTGLSADATRKLLSMKGPGVVSPFHPAQNPPRWSAFFNPELSVTGVLVGTPYEAVRQRMDATRRGGFYSTLDNSYLSAYVDRRHGPVLAIEGQAPTTPATSDGQATMAAAQLRYWSVCKYRSLADTTVDGCLADAQVPLQAQRRFTIVVSTPADRPANARPECGVAWLDWGRAGDGLGNPDGGFVILRQMMPAADFGQSVFSVRKPGEEQEVMGAYFPQAGYFTKAAFEARGCKGA